MPVDIQIAPPRAWEPINVRELWAHRELFLFLAWRDLAVRYKQTALGAVWVVLQPILTMAVFAVVFGRLIGVPTGGAPYPLFVYAALLPWQFFTKTVTQSTQSVVANTNLVTKVYFPRLLIPAAAAASGLVDMAVAALVVFVLMAVYGQAVAWTALLLPVLMVLTAAIALAVGVLLAALNVRYRDVGATIPLGLQLWMFATPIIYPATIVPEPWRFLLDFNPMTGVVEAFRAVLYGGPLDLRSLVVSAGVATVGLAVSCLAFRRMEHAFADVV